MSEPTNPTPVPPVPCGIDAQRIVWNQCADCRCTPAVAVPTDLAAWPDDVRERVIEAASRSLAHSAGVDGSTRRRRLVTAGAVDYYRDAARAAVTAALSALADATREAP